MPTSIESFKSGIKEGLLREFGLDVEISDLVLNETKKEIEGDYTLVLFPLVGRIKQSLESITARLSQRLKVEMSDQVKEINVISGFLNFTLNDKYWINQLKEIQEFTRFDHIDKKNETVLVEFSSPNTNKPLHLGHVRNILLGWSVSKILETCGYRVVKTQIINDRGIAICKSMLAWQKYGNEETPESSGIKGDFLVGKYYREFEDRFGLEYTSWQNSSQGNKVFLKASKPDEDKKQYFGKFKNEYFNAFSALGKEARDLLIKWEAQDEGTVNLWRKMNGWVYAGFDKTYAALGVKFDKLYYESETYLLGKDLIQNGLENGYFTQKEDNSIWVDLEDVGLDKKILLRSDGTSVYITQDLGTAQKRYEDHQAKKMIYVVGDEQDYHFQVLFETLKKLKAPYADGLYHLSYGMVDLPSGKMKSREGNVVDADMLISDVIKEVETMAVERGELMDLSKVEREAIYQKIGMAALKYFILRVNPRKRMTFIPEESVDIQGQTGPYIQNAFVRIQSIKRKLDEKIISNFNEHKNIVESEKSLIKAMATYPSEIQKAAKDYDPSTLASYAYDLAKKFHKLYHDVRILNAETDSARVFRLILAENVARVLQHSMQLLGIDMPDKM